MKHIYLLIFSILTFANGFAQDEFWGTTRQGGDGWGGVIFNIKADGTGYNVKYTFPVTNAGAAPKYAPLLYNNSYYGCTEFGGTFNAGVLYAYNKTTQVYTVLHSFKPEEGDRPLSNVVVINNKLYGTTYSYNGGNSKPGVIYEYDLSTNIYTIKKIFTNYTGAVLGGHPAGALSVYNNKIYGSTYDGGSGLAGSIFEYDPTTNLFRSLYGFGYSGGGYPNGKEPNGSLFLHNGALYGTTQTGGTNGAGVIFKFDLTTNSFTKLAEFGGIGNGNNPVDGMILYNNKFYGATPGGGTNYAGTIYSFDPATNVLTTLNNFAYNTALGVSPQFKFTIFNNLLYGSTVNNVNNDFNIFSYNPVTNSLTSEFSSGHLGEGINGEFLIDDNKFITVTTQYVNSMISYDPTAKTKTTLFKFNTFPLGANPQRSLLYDNGIFYSSTSVGGTNNLGVVFSFDAITNEYKVLYNLTTSAYSLGDFTKMGNTLYAPANSGYYGGSSTQNYGAVFYINLTNNAASFTPTTPGGAGAGPVGVMVPTNYPNELLLLTTNGIGSYAGGSMIRFNTTTNSFYGIPTSYFGSNTFPSYLTKTSDGRIFATTEYNGTFNQGCLHLQSVGTKTSFKSNTTGRGPNGAIAELNGKYYIATRYDGPGSGTEGTIVEIDPANMTLPTLKISLKQNDGIRPTGNLMVTNNKIYGVLASGGKLETNSTGELSYVNRGTFFSYDPSVNLFTKLYDFTGIAGESPASLILAPTGSLLPLQFITFNANKCNTNKVCLSWETANENNVSHFEVNLLAKWVHRQLQKTLILNLLFSPSDMFS